MSVSAETVKALRDETGVSVMDCKKALEEAAGNMDRAREILKEKSLHAASKKSDRTLGAGTVSSYIHNNSQVGALVLIACETDFVSKNEDFISLGRDIAMHIAAMRPESVDALKEQPFIKDGSQTIADLLSGASHKFGERIEVSKMSFFSVLG